MARLQSFLGNSCDYQLHFLLIGRYSFSSATSFGMRDLLFSSNASTVMTWTSFYFKLYSAFNGFISFIVFCNDVHSIDNSHSIKILNIWFSFCDRKQTLLICQSFCSVDKLKPLFYVGFCYFLTIILIFVYIVI